MVIVVRAFKEVGFVIVLVVLVAVVVVITVFEDVLGFPNNSWIL